MSQKFETTFKSLSGSWNLKREISTGDTLIGKAVFEPVSDTAFLLREEGELALSNGQNIQASRNWYWHLESVSTLEITYDALRVEPYHLVKLSKSEICWSGRANHLCGEDNYLGDYQFFEDRFTINQSVRGPNKNYSVASSYSK